MILIYNESTDPAFNLALEELLTANRSEEYFMLWRNRSAIIVGKHQNTAAEINGEFVKKNDIAVVRRITGGGAVYHDLGNINFSLVTPEQKWTNDTPFRYIAPVVNALKEMNITAEFSGRNDILAAGERKVSGCARSVIKNRTLFHGTLLFDTDLGVLADALNPDPVKIQAKGIKSVRARVGNLVDLLPERFGMAEFIRRLQNSLLRYYGLPAFEPPPAELLVEAGELAEKKYRTWEWNYGTPLAYEVEKNGRFAGGTVKAGFNVSDNRICQLHFTGDFFGSRPVEELTRRLTGLPPRRSEVEKALEAIDLADYLYGVTPAELAGLLAVSD